MHRQMSAALLVLMVAGPALSKQSVEAGPGSEPEREQARTPETEDLGTAAIAPGSEPSRRSRNPEFGGPNSPEGQFEENARPREPAFRFPAIYDTFQPWRDWKQRVNDKHGIALTGHYATLYQHANTSLTGEDTGSGGVFRALVAWTPFGRGTDHAGSLVVMVDHRHAYRDVAPANLAGELGYLGQTGTLFSDVDWVIPNLNWQQRWNPGGGMVVGRYDPTDYMNILGYSDPWRAFQNLMVLFEPSIAFADSSWGVGAGQWFKDQWYVIGGINDANGKLTDNLEFFDGGAEFYKWAQVGWSPSKAERYDTNVHLAGWHVDEREEAGIDSAHGVAIGANYTIYERWMPFLRAGLSQGNAALYNRSATIGVIRKFQARSDLLGVGFNWGDPPQEEQPEQKTLEAFWNIQFAPNLAITPSLQLLLDPAQNPEDDRIWVGGLRMRLTF